MTPTYEWLYENYCRELQRELRNAEESAVKQLSEIIPLTAENRIDLADCMARLRFQCGTESFAMGFQLGLHLTQDVGFSPTAS